MGKPVMFSSRSGLWETPQGFFDELDKEFHFTLDVCALPENAKCPRFYTPEQDGLKQPWEGVCWCNPPYGRGVGEWIRRAAQAAGEGAVVVMLLPSRTDTRWFHEYLYGNPLVELRFIKGRLRFGGRSAIVAPCSHNRRSGRPGLSVPSLPLLRLWICYSSGLPFWASSAAQTPS